MKEEVVVYSSIREISIQALFTTRIGGGPFYVLVMYYFYYYYYYNVRKTGGRRWGA